MNLGELSKLYRIAPLGITGPTRRAIESGLLSAEP